MKYRTNFFRCSFHYCETACGSSGLLGMQAYLWESWNDLCKCVPWKTAITERWFCVRWNLKRGLKWKRVVKTSIKVKLTFYFCFLHYFLMGFQTKQWEHFLNRSIKLPNSVFILGNRILKKTLSISMFFKKPFPNTRNLTNEM